MLFGHPLPSKPGTRIIMVASRFTLLFSLAYLAASLGAYAYDATAQTNVCSALVQK